MGRREQAAASRAGLVEAARACFAEQGYERTTVADILDRAGMARGALYHYFPGGKRDVFTAVFDELNEAFHERRDALAAREDPVERIVAGARLFLECCTDDEFAQIVLCDAPAVIPSQAGHGSTYQLLRAQLAELPTDGRATSFDVDVMASVLYGAVRAAGDVVVAAEDRGAALQEASRAVEVLLSGVLAAGAAQRGARARQPRKRAPRRA